MSDATQTFFRDLEQGRADPRAGRIRGSVRIEVEGGERVEAWVVRFDRGSVHASRGAGDAACILRADRETFDALVEGRMNATSALIRGTILATGDLEPLIYLQRLFPPPPPGAGPAGAGVAARVPQ